jgi:hypothetical protein
MVGQLLQAGLAYGLSRLVALCEAKLASCINADTAVDILLLAHACKAQVCIYDSKARGGLAVACCACEKLQGACDAAAL